MIDSSVIDKSGYVGIRNPQCLVTRRVELTISYRIKINHCAVWGMREHVLIRFIEEYDQLVDC